MSIKSSSLLIQSGNEECRISFYLEAETIGIDYVNMTADYNVRLYAKSNSEARHTVTTIASSRIEMLGRRYLLPTSFEVGYGETDVLSWSVYGVSAEKYPSGLPYTMHICPSCEAFLLGGLFQKNGSVGSGKIYTAPEVSVKAESFRLGEAMLFGGLFLKAGYDVTARVFIAGNEVASKVILPEDTSFPTEISWITPYKNERRVDAEVLFSASYLGKPLPSNLLLTVPLYLGEGDALPKVTVRRRFLSDNPRVASLDVAVKNKSSLVIEVEATGCFGADVVSCSIGFDGQKKEGSIYTSGVLTEAGVKGYSVNVTDSRGSVYTESGEIAVMDYAPPVFTAEARRTDSVGNESLKGRFVTFGATLDQSYPFDGINEYSFVYELRRAGNDLLIDRQDFANGSINIVDLGLDISSAYEFTVICSDSFGGVASRTYLLECERVELNIAKNRIGVGKYASEDQLLDCAWRIRCGGDIEFTNESGMLVSLREALRSYSGGECSLGGIYDVTTEAQLSSVLSPKADGVGISIVFVSAPSLSLGVGGYVILTYKNEYVSGYKVISTL